MFVVTEADAAAIRAAVVRRTRCSHDEQGGELAAGVELRRLYPGLASNERARDCARTIAGWKLLPAPVKRRRMSDKAG